MYTVTVTGFGHTRTYRDIESEMHDEFYVRAIDLFVKDIGVNRLPQMWNKVLEGLTCSHTYTPSHKDQEMSTQ